MASPAEYLAQVEHALRERGVSVRREEGALVLPRGHRWSPHTGFARWSSAQGKEGRLAAVERVIEDLVLQDYVLLLDDFAERMQRAFRAADIQVEREGDALVFASGRLSLVNLYAECASAPASELEPRIGSVVASWGAVVVAPRSWEEVQGKALPDLVTAAYRDTQDLRGDGTASEPALEVAPGLFLRIVLDDGAVTRELNPYLQRWGVAPQDALLQALRNQSAGGHPFGRIEAGVHQSAFGDRRDVATLLLPLEVFRQIGISGPPVVFPLAKHQVLIADATDLTALRSLLDRVEAQGLPPRSFAPRPLIHSLRNELAPWSLWAGPPFDEALRARIRRLHVAHEVLEYRSVRGPLQERMAPLFVTACEPCGEISTMCTWPPFEAVLPATDKIAVCGPGGRLVMAEAERVWALAGDLLVPLQRTLLPYRRALAAFPEDRFEALRAEGEDLGIVDLASLIVH